MNKVKITAAGQPCRKCGTPVIRQRHSPGFSPKPTKAYYFDWWFKCPSCRTLYMVEAAKRIPSERTTGQRSILDIIDQQKSLDNADLIMMPPVDNSFDQ